MSSISARTRVRRLRRWRPTPYVVDVVLDGLSIAVSLALFVALLWWMTTVASS